MIYGNYLEYYVATPSDGIQGAGIEGVRGDGSAVRGWERNELAARGMKWQMGIEW